MRTTTLAVALAVVALVATPVWAEQSELFGPSIQSIGMAGAGSALEDGVAVGTMNAASLGLADTDLLRLHYFGGHISLAPVQGVAWLDGRDEPMPSLSLQPQSLTVEFLKTLGPWFAAGVHVNFPIPYIYYLETKDPWVPYSMRWENRLGRGMGTAAMSIRIPVRGAPKLGGVLLEDALRGGLWFGFALSLRPKGIINVDLDIIGLEAEGDAAPQVSAVLNDVDIYSRYVWRPQLSMLLDFGTFAKQLEGFRFGISWKPESKTWISPIHLDVAVLDLENVSAVFSLVEVIQAEVWLGLIDFYDPHQVRLSLALDKPRFALTADVQINGWSQIVASYGRVVDGDDGEKGRLLIEWATGETDEYPAIGGRWLDQDQFRDTVDVAVGAELRPPGRAVPGTSGEVSLAVRFGGRWVQGVARPVDGPSGLIDSDTWTGAAGLGVELPFPDGWVISGPLSVDWAVQVIRITSFDLPKTREGVADVDIPVSYASGARWPGGWVVASGVSLGVVF